MEKIKNGDLYDVVKIDGQDVELPVFDLLKAGWHKVEDDEQIIKKVELSKEEVEFMECNKHLPFRSEAIDFLSSANTYVDEHAVTCEDDYMMLKRLVKAYFNGYTVRETKYYIKFPDWMAPEEEEGKLYLNAYSHVGWGLDTKEQYSNVKTQFTQSRIDELQKDEQAKGLDLNAFKVKVPDDELED